MPAGSHPGLPAPSPAGIGPPYRAALGERLGGGLALNGVYVPGEIARHRLVPPAPVAADRNVRVEPDQRVEWPRRRLITQDKRVPRGHADHRLRLAGVDDEWKVGVNFRAHIGVFVRQVQDDLLPPLCRRWVPGCAFRVPDALSSARVAQTARRTTVSARFLFFMASSLSCGEQQAGGPSARQYRCCRRRLCAARFLLRAVQARSLSAQPRPSRFQLVPACLPARSRAWRLTASGVRS